MLHRKFKCDSAREHDNQLCGCVTIFFHDKINWFVFICSVIILKWQFIVNLIRILLQVYHTHTWYVTLTVRYSITPTYFTPFDTFYAYNTLFPLYLLTLHLPRANDALAKKNEQQHHRGTLHLDVSIKYSQEYTHIYSNAQFACNDARYLL